MSWLAARAAGGAWLLRIDNLDGPRCPPGAAAEILRQLEAHGLNWDETPRHQSRHVAQYEQALAELDRRELLYPCRCTRAQLAASAHPGPDGPVYPGTCSRAADRDAGALRVRLESASLHLADRWAGSQTRDPARDVGDIVVRRADGQIAYQLACVVDEREQRITEVIRGADLLGSSFQQLALMRLLQQPPPAYGHLPVLLDPKGRKLSKQNHAPPLENRRAAANLLACLSLAGFAPDAGLARALPAEILAWGLAHWGAAKLTRPAQSGAAITYNAVQQTGFLDP
jgi:glutamyl-Q tRNA(Asp) synthetase